MASKLHTWICSYGRWWQVIYWAVWSICGHQLLTWMFLQVAIYQPIAARQSLSCDPSSAETFYKQLIAEDTQGHSADGKPLCLEGTVDAPWCSSWILNVAIWHGEEKKNSHPQETTEIHTLLTPATPNFNVVIGSAEHHQQKWLFFFGRAPETKFRGQRWIGGRGGHDLCGVVLHGMAFFFCLLRTRYDGIRDEVRFFIVMSHASLLAFISNVFSSRKTTFICIYILMFTIYTRIYDKIKRIWMHMICVMCI